MIAGELDIATDQRAGVHQWAAFPFGVVEYLDSTILALQHCSGEDMFAKQDMAFCLFVLILLF